MTLSALLDQLAGAGVRIRMAGPDRLEVSAPRGALTGELRQLIAQHKPELVDWLARVPGSPDEAAVPQVRPAPQDARLPFPPSDLQVSFLVGSHGGLELTVRPHQYYEWDLADLDPGRWAGALNAALHRQRANIVVVREDLQLQAVDDPGPVPVPVLDLRGLPEADARAELERVRAEMSGGELPLDRWPWLEARITRYGDDRVRLHYNHNNFFVDGVSLGRLLADVRHGYEHPDEPLPPVHLTYRDCVLALADLEASPEGRAAERYWRDRLPGLPVAPELPRTASDARGRSELERREQVLPRHSWDAVKRRAADRGLTPTAAAFAAYAEVVAYWSGSRHFLLNMMVTHRIPMHPQIRELFGNFAALYPLEVDWRPDEPFADRVSRLSARVMADLAQTSWSGTKVLQALNQVRGTPGVAVCPYVVGSGLFMGSLDRPDFSRLETPQVVLDCQFWEQADGSLWLVWDLVEALFPDGVAGAMQDAFRSLLERLAAGDAAWEARTPELLPAGQAEQRRRLNAVTAPVPDGLLHDGLAGRAAERPDRPCVVAADRTLDYGETARRSAALAGLLRDRGMTPGDLVAVVLPKGWEQVVAVFAVLAAGGAYVPVDPAWPDERVRHLLAETRAGAVLTGRPLADRLAGLTAAPVLPVDPADPGQAPPPAQAPRDPDDLAYVIYTSGSTGRPKGAMLSHRGPLNTVLDINRRFAVGPDDVLLGVSSLCFDLSVYDVFGAVAAGATLVLPAPDGDGPAGWLDLVRRHGVTVWNSVPALMELVVDEAEAAGVQLTSLRTVLLSGDWVPVGLPGRIRRVAPRARVVSLGGATEASIWSIAHPVEPADQDRVSIPYGRPLANQTWHVLDDRGRDAPTWVAGELYIGGAGVALGYLHDPERTAAAFVAHPRTGERLYRTGDRGRYLPDGEVEFLGRVDLQVKIQGFRVEPGEVEHVLGEHRAVRQAAVVARSTPSGRQLAAFVAGRDPAAPPDPDDLRAYLAGRLPAHLVPSHLAVLERVPLTGNGKVDRAALEQLGTAGPEERHEHVPPRTATEQALARAWEEVLEVGPVGVHDDFFALGGQSFAALRMTGLLHRRLRRQVPIGALLEHRTVAALAGWLDDAAARWSPLVRLREVPGTDPWFLVHPAGGDVLCYRELAGRVRRSCFAFQAPGPAAGRPPPRDVDELARQYVAELLAVQPREPYLLAGWSSGGPVAVAMADLLERSGRPVRRVLLLDAPAPTVTPAPEVDEVTLLLWFAEDLQRGFDARAVDEATLRELRAVPAGERLERVLALARGAGADHPAELAGTYAVFRGVVGAVRRYRPPRVEADLCVLRAAEGRVTEFDDHPHRADPDWGWSGLTSGQVDTVTVAGSHHTMLAAEHLDRLAAVVAERLERRLDRVG